MAEASLLRKNISKSEQVNKLPESAQILYTWMFAHLDAEGRFSGNPKVVKNTVIPLKKHSVAKVDEWLNMMQELKDEVTGQGLIERYEVDGNQYLWYPDEDEQSPRERDTKQTDDILDPVFGQMVKDYEDNIGMLSPMLVDRLKLIQDEYPEGWFAKAVNEAVTYGKRNLKYIEAILKNWQAGGINPMESVPAKEKTETGRTQEYEFD